VRRDSQSKKRGSALSLTVGVIGDRRAVRAKKRYLSVSYYVSTHYIVVPLPVMVLWYDVHTVLWYDVHTVLWYDVHTVLWYDVHTVLWYDVHSVIRFFLFSGRVDTNVC
jgi:hypothetical protein